MKASHKTTLLWLGSLLLSLAVVSADSVFVVNAGSNTIVKFNSSGLGSIFASGLSGPGGITFDNSGNLYVANSGNDTIMKFDSNGNGSVFASMYGPFTVAFDGRGSLYVDSGENGTGTIMKFDSTGNGSVFTSGTKIFFGLACDAAGNLYAANYFGNTIEKFDSSGTGSVFASTSPNPIGVAFDPAGNLFVSHASGVNMIEKFGPGGNRSVFANSGLSGPYGLACDARGNLYVANAAGYFIEKFTPEGSGSVFASTGLSQPSFIAVVPSLDILSQPRGQISCFGGSATFSVRASGLPPLTYQWYFDSALLTGITNSQITLTNLQATNAGPYSVVVSNVSGSLASSNAQLVLNDACVDIRMYAGLTIVGLQGATYVLKFATNLAETNFENWTSLATNTMTGSNWFYLDTASPGSPHRFYGVKIVP